MAPLLFSILLSIFFNCAQGNEELERAAIEDINREKDHVTRFQNLVTLAFNSKIENPASTSPYTYESPDPVFEDQVLKYLLGYYGLKKNHSKDETRYKKQVLYALEYIIRSSGYTHTLEVILPPEGSLDFPEEVKKDIRLMSKIKIILDQMKKEGKVINNQHVSWTVLMAQTAYFNTQRELIKDDYRDPLIKKHGALYDYVKDPTSYDILGDHKASIFGYIVKNRVASADQLEDQLQKVKYRDLEKKIFDFYKVYPMPSSEYLDDFSDSIPFDGGTINSNLENHRVIANGVIELPNTHIDIKPPVVQKREHQEFRMEANGTLVNPGGQGESCFSYASYWEGAEIETQADTIENAITAREHIKNTILKKLDSPLVKYWLTKLLTNAQYQDCFAIPEKSSIEIFGDRVLLKKFIEKTIGTMDVSHRNDTFETIVGYIYGGHEIYIFQNTGFNNFRAIKTIRLFPEYDIDTKRFIYISSPGHRMYIKGKGFTAKFTKLN